MRYGMYSAWAAICLVTACVDSSSPATATRVDASPGDSEAPTDSNPDTKIETDAAVSASLSALGLSTRLAKADLSTSPCKRLEARANKFLALGQQNPILEAKLAGVTAAVRDALPLAGPFDPLLNGEVKNSFAAYNAGDGINPTEARLLVLDLAAHLTAAGVPSDNVDAIVASLSALLASAGDSGDLRLRISTGVVDLAELFALTERCAPKA